MHCNFSCQIYTCHMQPLHWSTSSSLGVSFPSPVVGARTTIPVCGGVLSGASPCRTQLRVIRNAWYFGFTRWPEPLYETLFELKTLPLAGNRSKNV